MTDLIVGLAILAAFVALYLILRIFTDVIEDVCGPLTLKLRIWYRCRQMKGSR